MEQCRMEIKAQAAQLCKMLSKPDSQRMPFQGVQIAKSLQRIPFFLKFFDMKSQPFINLCITSSILQFSPHQDIYSTQQQRYIYIILQGSVKATLKNSETTLYQQGRHYLSEFGIFGETQFLFGLDKRYQIITARDCVVKCMVLQEAALKRIINPSMQKFVDKATNYLQVNDYFEELTLFEKKQLVIHLSLQNFTKGDIIIDTSSTINHILFLVYGRVLVVKSLKVKSSTKSQKYKIDQLSQMDSFGQYQAYNRKQSDVSLVAETTGAYYSLDYQSLKESNHRILRMIKERAIPYPDQEEIQFLHEIKNTMKQQQDKIVKKNKLFH